MKKIIIPIPEGYKYLQVEVADEIVIPLISFRALKDLPNGIEPGQPIFDEAAEPVEDEDHAAMLKEGWEPVAVTGEGLKTGDNEVMHSIGYRKKAGKAFEYRQLFTVFTPAALHKLIEEKKLHVYDNEEAFNKKYLRKNA